MPRTRREYTHAQERNSPRTPRRDAKVSVASVLRGCRALHLPHEQHLHVWAYVPYRRWLAPLPAERFAVDCMPPYEGWSACWIRPLGSGPRRVGGIGTPVLELDLCYHDGTAQRGYATRDGELIVVSPATAPRDGVFVDARHTVLQMDILPIARTLTLSDIQTRRRGTVHGSVCARNNSRKVSHIVGPAEDDRYEIQRIPMKHTSPPETVKLPRTAVYRHAPELINEYTYRTSGLLSRASATAMLPYIESLIQRAIDVDLVTQESYSPAGHEEALNALSEEVARGIDSLRRAMSRFVH